MVMPRVLVAMIAAIGIVAPAQARDIKLEDSLRWVTASSVRISPDGRTIVFRRSEVDPKIDSEDGKLWIMAADGSGQRLLCDCGSAVWLPDGRLSYQTSVGGPRHFVIRTVAGPDKVGPEQTVAFDGPLPNGVAWSRDGKTLAFVSSVPAKAATWPVNIPAAPEGAKWNPDPTIIDGWQYRVGVDRYRTTRNHLFVAPAAGGKVRQVTSGEWDVGSLYSGTTFGTAFVWSADGKTLYFDGGPQTDDMAGAQRSDINAVDVATGAVKRLTTNNGFWNGVILSPDGKQLAYTGNLVSPDAFPARQLRVMNVDGSGDRLLWDDMPDRIGQMQWNPDGKSLLVSMNHEGATELVEVSLDGKRRTVVTGKFRFYITSIAPGVAVGSITTATRDSEVARIDLRPGRIRTLTNVNTVLDEVKLGTVEDFWTRSADGTQVQWWLTKPAAFDPAKRYPLIVDIHGGPDAMAGWDFDFRHHDFAARGYLVVHGNPRGSTGYGTRFANGIDGGFPGRRDTEDMEAIVKAAIAQSNVDPSRVFVMGCSGGGALSTWLTAKTKLFAAAVVMCAVTDWMSMPGTSDINTWTYTRFRKPFWEDPQPWLDHSPVMQVGSITAPTLIAIGARDQRTPVSQSAELYTALKYRGVPTRLLIFPNEGHGPWRAAPSDMMRLQLYIDEWFRTLGKPGSAAASPPPAANAP